MGFQGGVSETCVVALTHLLCLGARCFFGEWGPRLPPSGLGAD